MLFRPDPANQCCVAFKYAESPHAQLCMARGGERGKTRVERTKIGRTQQEPDRANTELRMTKQCGRPYMLKGRGEWKSELMYTKEVKNVKAVRLGKANTEQDVTETCLMCMYKLESLERREKSPLKPVKKVEHCILKYGR